MSQHPLKLMLAQWEFCPVLPVQDTARSSAKNVRSCFWCDSKGLSATLKSAVMPRAFLACNSYGTAEISEAV